MQVLKIGPREFEPGLVIFDKDGTLIDFDWMWGAWATDLATRLEAASGLACGRPLHAALGFDPVRGRTLPGGKLAVQPMAELRALTCQVMEDLGLSSQAAAECVAAAWAAPDPAALAKPITDLRALFTTLRARGCRLAVATTDDRAPTLTTLAGLGVGPLVDTLICADDGVPVKPAPHMVTTLCDRLGVPARRAVMVGDTVADMVMGRSAGAGLVVGVLSGIADKAALAPLADVLIDSVAELV